MKALRWQEGKLVSLRLGDGLYALAQMARSPFLQCLDISRRDEDWEADKVGSAPPLFQVPVGKVVLQKLVSSVLAGGAGIPRFETQRRWINCHINYDGGFVFRGGDLIEFDENTFGNNVTAPRVKTDLTVEEDREIIEKTELINMWGDQDLGDRLRRYFDTGINRDDLKFEVFPGLWNDREALSPLTRRLPVPLRGGKAPG